jgi:alpha-beta hydrolase superfamily lysophospholipase
MEQLALEGEGGPVQGWLVLPSADAIGTVILWGGLSGWGASYLSAAESLSARGMACILAEGPGQGMTRLRSRIFGREETLPGYARFIDFAVTDHRLAGAPIGIQGNSFGGLIAARLTAQDDRVAACAVNCAPSAVIAPPVRSAREQILAFVGTDQMAMADEVLDGLRYDPNRHQIGVPLLVLHGGADPFVTEENTRAFLSGARHHDTQILIWPDGEHTLYNHAAERNAAIADWFADQLTHT